MNFRESSTVLESQVPDIDFSLELTNRCEKLPTVLLTKVPEVESNKVSLEHTVESIVNFRTKEQSQTESKMKLLVQTIVVQDNYT